MYCITHRWRLCSKSSHKLRADCVLNELFIEKFCFGNEGKDSKSEYWWRFANNPTFMLRVIIVLSGSAGITIRKLSLHYIITVLLRSCNTSNYGQVVERCHSY